MASKQQISKLFQSSGGAIGLDDESSGILIHNLNASVMPLCQGSPFTDEEQETDDFRIIGIALDASGSMQEVESDLIECFNEILIPGLLGGALSQVGAIRMGGLKFATSVTPLWKTGFHPLPDIPKLTKADYRANGSTALHQGVLDLVTACAAYALELRKITGTNPETTIAVLSDGANNQDPHNPGDVFTVLSKLSPELFTLVFFYFETYEIVDAKQIARSMGFRDIEESKALPGETKEELKRRFRNKMKVFSDSMVKSVSTSRVGKSGAQKSSPTGYWNP